MTYDMEFEALVQDHGVKHPTTISTEGRTQIRKSLSAEECRIYFSENYIDVQYPDGWHQGYPLTDAERYGGYICPDTISSMLKRRAHYLGLK